MVGDPVTGDEFFDREDIMKRLDILLDKFKKGKRQNVALMGLRKIGKTSIIFELANSRKDIPFVYIYLEENMSVERFSSLVFRSLLVSSLGNDLDLDELLIEAIDVCPKTVKRIMRLRQIGDKKELFEGTISLFELYARETKNVVVCMDEFQRILDLGKWSVDVFRKCIMQQKNTLYLLSGSAVSLMLNLLSVRTSPLFGHFKIMNVENFSYADSRAFLIKRSRTEGIVINELYRNLLIHLTQGNPFYLSLFIDEAVVRCKLIGVKQPNKNIIREAIESLVFSSDGEVYLYLKDLIDSSLGKKGKGYVNILIEIARGNNIISKIAKSLDKEMENLTYPLRRLIEVDLIYKKDGKFFINDPLLEFWLGYVYPLKERAIIHHNIDVRVEEFRSQVSQMISEFKSELGKARESQIREIFSRKGFTVSSGNLEGKEFDLIAKKNDKLLIGECKTGNITVKEVNKFIRKLKKVSKARKVLFSLFGITEKARGLCKKEMIEVWDSERINRERKKLGFLPLGL